MFVYHFHDPEQTCSSMFALHFYNLKTLYEVERYCMEYLFGLALLFWKLLTIGIQLWQFVELNGQTMNWAKSELYRKWIWGENFLRRLFHYGLS